VVEHLSFVHPVKKTTKETAKNAMIENLVFMVIGFEFKNSDFERDYGCGSETVASLKMIF